MKKYLCCLLVGLSFALATTAQITKATLQASGLTCALCAKAVYSNLTSLPFVDSVDTDLNASAFVITFKKGMIVDLDALNKKVQDAGFSIASLSVSAHIIPGKIELDKHITIGQQVFHFLNVKSQDVAEDITFKLVDQAFVSAKEFKKVVTLTKMQCVKTGRAESCCAADGIKESTRIFHAII